MEEQLYLWGVAGGSARYWQTLDEDGGDVVLFYTESGRYTHGAYTRGVEHHQAFGKEVFAWDEDPFEYLIYLDEPFRVDISSAQLHSELGFNRDYPLNFQNVVSGRLADIRTQYGSLRAYIRQERREQPESSEKEISEAQDDLAQAVAEPPKLTEERQAVQQTERPARSEAFRRQVREQYDAACAVCGTARQTPTGNPEVEAAHIYPRSENGANDIRNGLALCKLHHWAFDNGWIAISDEYEILVRDAPTVPGYTDFAELDGMEIDLPAEMKYHPHPLYLSEHRALHGFTSD